MKVYSLCSPQNPLNVVQLRYSRADFGGLTELQRKVEEFCYPSESTFAQRWMLFLCFFKMECSTFEEKSVIIETVVWKRKGAVTKDTKLHYI